MAAEGITPDVDIEAAVTRLTSEAVERWQGRPEGELDEIRAWRRTFTAMGLKPTQYRNASEALLRGLRRVGSLPRIHPLVNLCNALSVTYAVPVAALDLDHISGDLRVRRATGSEVYAAFSGADEHPDEGEVVFADDAGHAHARRWCNRQSRLSAMSRTTSRALVVCEAQHDGGADTVADLIARLADEVAATWSVVPTTVLLTAADPAATVED